MPSDHHRGGHHGQREDARSKEVDGIVGVRRQHVDEAEEDEEQHRDAEGDEQLLAVADPTPGARRAAAQ
jgi:hypothetical protein